MRTTIVNGRAFKCPQYLVRAGIGWQVRLPGRPTVYFADGQHGSTRGAHRAATDHLAAQGPVHLERAEQSIKQVKTGRAGLLVNFKPARGKRSAAAEFQVRVPGQPIRVIYIGTEATYEANYPAKFQLALAELEAKREANRRSGNQRRTALR